jgi:cytochrome P450
MTLSAASFFSAMLQLEKVYFLHYDFHPEEKPLISSVIFIPVLSTLAFRESMALCSLTVCFLAFYIYHQIQLLTNARLNMPIVKVSTQLPFLGTALEFLSNTPWDLMEDWHRSYGRIYSFKLLGKTMVSIEHPDHLKEVLQSKIQNVKKDVGFAYKPFLPILGKGIVTSEGKSWMNQRRKISAALKVDILEEIPRATLKSVKRLMVKMDKCVEDSSSTIDLAEELRHLTLQVISETFMGLEAEESDTTFATMYYPIVEEGNKRVWRPERSYMFFTPSFWKHIFGVRRLNNYVSNLITKRWDLRNKNRKINDKVKEENEQVHTKDILDKVLDHFEKENPGKSLSPSDVCQLRDEFKTFMLAGHETSAAMMTWSFYELMKDDKLMEKVCFFQAIIQ